jgi:hypothetical protein
MYPRGAAVTLFIRFQFYLFVLVISNYIILLIFLSAKHGVLKKMNNHLKNSMSGYGFDSEINNMYCGVTH